MVIFPGKKAKITPGKNQEKWPHAGKQSGKVTLPPRKISLLRHCACIYSKGIRLREVWRGYCMTEFSWKDFCWFPGCSADKICAIAFGIIAPSSTEASWVMMPLHTGSLCIGGLKSPTISIFQTTEGLGLSLSKHGLPNCCFLLSFLAVFLLLLILFIHLHEFVHDKMLQWRRFLHWFWFSW